MASFGRCRSGLRWPLGSWPAALSQTADQCPLLGTTERSSTDQLWALPAGPLSRPKPAGRLSGYRVGSGASERQGLVENCRFAFGFAGSTRSLNIDAPYAALRVEWIAGEPPAS
jgi:hypothetical protein